MANYLKFKNYDTVELVGLVSNMGVISNAVLIKAALPETEVIVNTEYTASADKELEAKAFDVMEGLQITVVRPEA